jgi:uncharacterized repeat protein (TIGR04138 family)
MASTKGTGCPAPGCSAHSASTSTSAGLGRPDVVGVQSSILWAPGMTIHEFKRVALDPGSVNLNHMLCEKCQLREATVFVTNIIGGEMHREKLCEPCAMPKYGPRAENATLSKQWMLPGQYEMFNQDYPPSAYILVIMAIKAATSSVAPGGHVPARDIAEAFRTIARIEYGADALSKLAEMQIRTTEDIGKLVFALVDAGRLAASQEDTLEAFIDIYDFTQEFPVA